MTTTITWNVNDLVRTTADGKVTAVNYMVTAADGTYKAGAHGNVELKGDVTIPFADLTEAVCVGWVQDALGQAMPEKDADGKDLTAAERKAAAMKQIEDQLEASIAEQKAPTRAWGTPWA